MYSYKDLGSAAVFIYQNSVKEGTITDQTAPKFKVFREAEENKLIIQIQGNS